MDGAGTTGESGFRSRESRVQGVWKKVFGGSLLPSQGYNLFSKQPGLLGPSGPSQSPQGLARSRVVRSVQAHPGPSVLQGGEAFKHVTRTAHAVVSNMISSRISEIRSPDFRRSCRTAVQAERRRKVRSRPGPAARCPAPSDRSERCAVTKRRRDDPEEVPHSGRCAPLFRRRNPHRRAPEIPAGTTGRS